MAVPNADPHVEAVKVLLAAGLPAGVVVHDGDVPDTPGQTYVTVYPDPGHRDWSSIRAVSDQLAMTVQVTCVGTTPLQARQVTDAVCAALVDRRPVVAGRTCWPITQVEGTPPVQKDDQTRDPAITRPRFYLTPRFVVSSTV